MRVHYVYCHPLPDSFHAALCASNLAALREAGHRVDLLDLYAEGFDPVLSAEERRCYHDLDTNRLGVERYIERLMTTDALFVQFPVWSFGPPALLKGWFDKLFKPGVGFVFAGTDPAPNLQHLRHVVGVTTYGRRRREALWIGDPPRKLITRYLKWFVAKDARVRYEALYHMNAADAARRGRFLGRCAARCRSFA